MLLNKTKICALMSLPLVLFGVVLFAKDGFAADQGIQNVESTACSGGAAECWTSQILKGGGVIWIKSNFKVDKLYLGPGNKGGGIPNMRYPASGAQGSAYGYAICKDNSPIYMLVSLWHKNGTDELTGQVYGPTNQYQVDNPLFGLGAGGYIFSERKYGLEKVAAGFKGKFSIISGDEAFDAYIQMVRNAGLKANWGHISWFCGTAPEQKTLQTTNNCPLADLPNSAANTTWGKDIAGSGTENSGNGTSYSGIRSDVSLYNDYQPFIYAKPGDKYNWAHCYYKEEQQVTYTYERESNEIPPEHRTGGCDGNGAFSVPYYMGEYKNGGSPSPPHRVTYLPGLIRKDNYVVKVANNHNKGNITTSNHVGSESVSFSNDNSGKIQLSGAKLDIDSGGSITGITLPNPKNGSAVFFSGSGGRYNYTYTVASGKAGTVSTQKVATDTTTNSVYPPQHEWPYAYNCEYYWVNYHMVPQPSLPNPIPCPSNPSLICGFGTPIPQPDIKVIDNPHVSAYNTVYAQHGSPNRVYVIGSQTSWNNDSSHASIYIPYNFATQVNSGSIHQDITVDGQKNGNDPVYDSQDQVVLSNEKVTISGAYFSIGEKFNNLTLGVYTTETTSGRAEYVSFYLKDDMGIPGGSVDEETGSVCEYYNGYGAIGCEINKYKDDNGNIKELVETGVFQPGTHSFGTHSFNIRNVPAGYKFCTAVGVTPTNSGADDNGVTGNRDGSFSGTPTVNTNWNISSPTCRTVASSPNIQVWGGNMANAGSITTGISYKTQSEGVGRYFSSWAEFAIINNGQLTGFSSGAANGYGGPGNALKVYNKSVRSGTVGGIAAINSLNYAPLTLPNSNCVKNDLGICHSNSTKSGISMSSSLIQRILDRYRSESGFASACRKRVNCSYHPDVKTINTNGAVLKDGATEVYYSNSSINIDSNLLIKKTGLSSAKDVSNYVIIAEGDINISSNATEINAWLISRNGTVNTCYDRSLSSGNISTDGCPKLKINGVVFAGSLTANRAGGGGAQESSGIIADFDDSFNTEPGEIINLSAASYLWAISQARQDTEAHTVYTRTLAPRL